MTISKSRPSGLLVAGCLLALGGCGGSSSDPAEFGGQAISSRMGTLNLSVSDAPIKDAAKVCIKFDGAELKPSGDGDSINIDFDDSVIINLLENQGAVSESLLSAGVEAGTYQWIRLKVDAVGGSGAGTTDPDPTDPVCNDTENGSYLVTDSGAVYNLFVPSGSQTGLKLIKNIIVPAGGTADYTAEWDLGKSFIAPPGLGTNEAIMKPVVKLVANGEVGTLFGEVADGLINPNPADPALCDVENGFGPTVWVFDDNGDPDDPVNGEDGSLEPVATGRVDQDMQGMPYTYEIGFLVAGDYEAAYTCNGEDFYPVNGKEAIITEGNDTEVNFDLDSPPPPTS